MREAIMAIVCNAMEILANSAPYIAVALLLSAALIAGYARVAKE